MIKKPVDFVKKLWKSKFTRQALSIGSILLTMGILSWLVYSQWDLLKEQLVNIRPFVLIFSFIIYACILFLTAGIWAQIMNALGHRAPFKTHFFTYCISALGKRLPGTFWYIAWRANLYQEKGYSNRLIVLTSGIEMISTILAAMVVSIAFSIPLINNFTYSIIGFLIVIVATLIVLHPKVNQWVFKKLKVDFSKFSYKDLLLWTAQYALVYILVGSLLFSFGNLFSNFPIKNLSYFIGASALTGILSRLFLFLPSNFGFGEVSLSLLLSAIMPTSLAVIIAVSNRIIIIFFEILWALFAYTTKTIKTRHNPK